MHNKFIKESKAMLAGRMGGGHATGNPIILAFASITLVSMTAFGLKSTMVTAATNMELIDSVLQKFGIGTHNLT
jgi:hypothetical protein